MSFECESDTSNERKRGKWTVQFSRANVNNTSRHFVSCYMSFIYFPIPHSTSLVFFCVSLLQLPRSHFNKASTLINELSWVNYEKSCLVHLCSTFVDSLSTWFYILFFVSLHWTLDLGNLRISGFVACILRAGNKRTRFYMTLSKLQKSLDYFLAFKLTLVRYPIIFNENVC